MMNKPEMRIDDKGTKEWCLSILHREDGPAVEYPDGTKKWCLHGKFHREDGPAVESPDGYKAWYLNGDLHREDGPAIECPDGYKAWYLNGEKLTENEFNRRTQMTLDKLMNHLSGSNLVEPITLSNGVELSIQASEIHYCRPQQDEGPWTEVEVRITHEDYWRVNSEMMCTGIDNSFSGVSEKYWLGANVNAENLVDFINLVEEWQGNE